MTSGRKKKVNLFIIGVPKAGTTSLYYYLSQHPDIEMSCVKEPHYFSTDFPDFTNISTLDEYHSLFNWADETQYFGEASVWYLYSKEAVENILEYNPDAKFIVMLRDPIELLPSLHNQLKISLMEDIEEVDKAWKAIADRKEGKRIPSTCREPKMLYYDEVLRLGEQMKSLLTKVLPSNLHVIQFDEFKTDNKEVIKDVLAFLGLPESVENLNFEVHNERSEIRSAMLNRLLFDLSRNIRPVIKLAKKVAGVEQFGLLKKVKEYNKKKTEKQMISESLRRKVNTFLESDSKLLDMELNKYHRSQSSG